MKLKKVLKIIPDIPARIWSPETELSDIVEPCGPPLIVAWDEEVGETADICTISPDLSPEVSRALALYITHCYNKFNMLLDFIKACGDCQPDEIEDFIVNNINDIIDAAEEVKEI